MPDLLQDFFIADIFDASLKDDEASMEHPLFTLRAGDKRVHTYGFIVTVWLCHDS
ncbi:MAG: hypothetical protein JSC188_000449 [Candidatus Tokpelaia sp. JSC188]|nr:MAG: hypothetical protein JSC188_000449 [Candidatus Tokpelaia sp. JSC188]